MGRRNKEIRENEVTYDKSEQLVSTTDLRGVITYANKIFCQVAGYSLDELVGKNHNIVRHPDMPKAAFEDLWSKMKAGQSWRGMVKNRCKDGSYYWVDAYVTPLYENSKHIGYQSVRIRPSNELKTKAEDVYKRINSGESIEPKLTSIKSRRYLSIVSIVGLMTWSLLTLPIMSSVILFIFLMALFIINIKELYSTPLALDNLQEKFDSPSRLIY